ncbi:MAG: type IV pilus twitching motility protein PilT [Lachnospiraceae bacterium]|nr:type IV pilus twitching motility protein PilT [Lachnospiraceae bacterium]MBQ9504529.1 type IV pilus twitching motility protein PilT [Lachnospiraceae bacterium]
MQDIKEALRAAMDRGASDVHFSVGRPAMLRIDGKLVPIEEDRLMPADTERLILPVLNEQNIAELKEKGEIDLALSVEGIGRFRINVFMSRGSYAAALRLLPYNIPTPEDLNLPAAVVETTNKKRGLVLVTGPTGSGKSTTLASLINEINRKYPVHIITLEDPIEYLHRSQTAIVNQREVGLDTQSYADALRAVLRQDPDIVLLGEMRDLDTISTAVTAAETGHLVFSTLHTMGAAATIDRIIDVFPPHQQEQIRIQLSTVLECVVSQQLLPTLGGGRCAAFEVMVPNPAIRNLIREGKTYQITSMIQTSRKAGMMLLDDYLAELYIKNKISRDTAISFAQDYSYIERKLL